MKVKNPRSKNTKIIPNVTHSASKRVLRHAGKVAVLKREKE